MAWREEYNAIVENIADVAPARKYYLDPVYGSDGGDGSKDAPVKTLTAGYSMLRTKRHDTLYVIGGASALAQTAIFTFDKDYTRIIGVGPRTLTGGRSRLTNSVTTATTGEFVISGTGCMFEGLNWQYGDSGVNTSVIGVSITGDGRIEFRDCSFEGPINATVGGASYRVVNIGSGVQDISWRRCHFGQRTILATGAAGATVYFAGSNNTNFTFEDCQFNAYNSNTASCTLGFANNAMPDSGWTLLRNCVVINHYNANIADPIRFTTGGHGTVILQGCALAGLGTLVWATGSWKTNIFVCNAAGASTGGVGANPA